jgi:hypothetical protein
MSSGVVSQAITATRSRRSHFRSASITLAPNANSTGSAGGAFEPQATRSREASDHG